MEFPFMHTVRWRVGGGEGVTWVPVGTKPPPISNRCSHHLIRPPFPGPPHPQVFTPGPIPGARDPPHLEVFTHISSFWGPILEAALGARSHVGTEYGMESPIAHETLILEAGVYFIYIQYMCPLSLSQCIGRNPDPMKKNFLCHCPIKACSNSW